MELLLSTRNVRREGNRVTSTKAFKCSTYLQVLSNQIGSPNHDQLVYNVEFICDDFPRFSR